MREALEFAAAAKAPEEVLWRLRIETPACETLCLVRSEVPARDAFAAFTMAVVTPLWLLPIVSATPLRLVPIVAAAALRPVQIVAAGLSGGVA